MSNLIVVINRKSKVARFSGSGTFHAKDAIKSLGQARFLSAEKAWEVRSFELAVTELEILFPNITIEEHDHDGEPVAETPAARTLPEGLPDGLSVSQFLLRVRTALRTAFPGTFCVYGVLSEVDFGAGGRIFMDLKDGPESDDRVKCVIWRDAEKKCAALKKAGFALEPELQVMFEVSVNLNSRGAQLSLSVERIIPEYTIGKLAALREQTNERLKKEGLFDKNRALRLPFLPRRLGILTSSGGTVINDFMASLDTAQFGFELFWCNVSVQGNDAKQSILRGLETMRRQPDLDAVLIFRGGGSQAELAVFNDYEIAKTVCLFPLPVIAAIGHQEDHCSVQDVSFKALGVPKDVGRFFADIVLDFRRRFLQSVSAVNTFALQRVNHSESTLELHARSIMKFLGQYVFVYEQGIERHQESLPALCRSALHASRQRFTDLVSPLGSLGGRVLELSRLRLDELKHRVWQYSNAVCERTQTRFSAMGVLTRELGRVIEQKDIRLDAYQEIFEAIGPETQLRRGFAIIRTADGGGFITRGENVKPETEVLIQFSDQQRKATIHQEKK